MKTDNLRIRVTEDWKKRVEACAEEYGFGLSELARMAVEDAVTRLEMGGQETLAFRHFNGRSTSIDPRSPKR
ncbi:MAG: hypothetical protein OXD36_02400 [Rhodobacter sp.]|nr:hypothetical protein [Rhodobacter sp.]